MLTARTKSGKKFCLAYHYKKETLLALRNKEEFYCPVCGEKVVLRLGDSKIYHFAHRKGGSCHGYFENETECHLQGKLQLFQWLKDQNVPAELEYYDHEIEQRPDILFVYQGRKYALEYQCSPISTEIFQKRTKGYFLHGYKPLWILGKSELEDHYPFASITNFQYLFLQKAKTGQMFIPVFSPNKNSLLILSSIYPYSAKNALVVKSSLPLKKVRLPSLFEPNHLRLLNVDRWKMAVENFISSYLLYPNVRQRQFLTELYQSGLNPFLLPPEIGLPVPSGVWIQTSPLVWQLYFYLDVLRGRLPGDQIGLKDIERKFTRRMKTREIQTRNLPLMNDCKPFMAIVEYTRLLTKLGVLTQKTQELFQVKRNLIIPQTNREKEKMTAAFYQQNSEILLK